MFLRYTHLGIGHPVGLRKIVRECFDDYESTVLTEMDDANDGEGREDTGEQYMDDNPDKDESENDLSEDESEEEHEGGEDREEVDEEYDDLYF